MNNYPSFKNYNYTNLYNNPNNPFNNQYDSMLNNMINKESNVFNEQANKLNQNTTTLYNPYNGFIRGNLFKNMYEPYKREEPYEIKPANEQAKLLTDIDALGFAMIDLNLFLDVNPNNQDAIKLFNQYRNQKESLTKEYENRFGPITLDSDSLNSFPWAWIDMPWPWDN